MQRRCLPSNDVVHVISASSSSSTDIRNRFRGTIHLINKLPRQTTRRGYSTRPLVAAAVNCLVEHFPCDSLTSFFLISLEQSLFVCLFPTKTKNTWYQRNRYIHKYIYIHISDQSPRSTYFLIVLWPLSSQGTRSLIHFLSFPFPLEKAGDWVGLLQHE